MRYLKRQKFFDETLRLLPTLKHNNIFIHFSLLTVILYLVVLLPLPLELPSTWCLYNDFLQGNGLIPRLCQMAGLKLSGPIHTQDGKQKR